MKVASFNVNSVRARKANLLEWLGSEEPDVVCLQETKVPDDAFPSIEVLAAGYRVLCHGQKTYNGVAILARDGAGPFELLRRGLPGDGDGADCRLLAARLGTVAIVDVYVPNGQAVGSDKYAFKLDWLRRLQAYVEDAFRPEQELLVCGDFNVALDDRDLWAPDALRGGIMCSELERAAVRPLLSWGLHDTLRQHHAEGGLYSWWDYRGAAVRNDHGWRIDLILASRAMAQRCVAASIDAFQRKLPNASDHAPIVAVFE